MEKKTAGIIIAIVIIIALIGGYVYFAHPGETTVKIG